jgi:hypothetical protein
VLADEPARWEALGFAVAGQTMRLGSIRVVLAGHEAGRGILRWSLREIASTELDGLPTILSQGAVPADACEHPNGLSAIDHVVCFTPKLDRAMEVLQAAGLDLRRIRERPTPAGAPRQAFFRLGETILEVVQEPIEAIERSGDPDGPTRFWGIALVGDDLEGAVEHMGVHASEIRPAVQYGRQIVTLKRSAGLAIPVALMSRAVA